MFSAPMVRALLAGTKTQTRRLVKVRKSTDYLLQMNPELWATRCPYGQPGDQLWVRETFQPLWAEDCSPPQGFAGPEGWRISYPSTDGVVEFHDADEGLSTKCSPSIHMPRWASRITLELTSVRVERLQDISEEDAKAEGVTPNPAANETAPWGLYRVLWESINGQGSWDLNPWVWVINFKRVPQVAT